MQELFSSYIVFHNACFQCFMQMAVQYSLHNLELQPEMTADSVFTVHILSKRVTANSNLRVYFPLPVKLSLF